MKRLRNVLRPADLLRLWWAGGGELTRPLVVHTRDNLAAEIRPAPSLDYMIFYEIFVNGAYEPVWDELPVVSRVVDVGGYVGYSCLFWARRFPGCQVTVYEPMPEHIEQLRGNLTRNRLDNVTIRPVAAGAKVDRLFLTPQSAASRLTAEAQAGAVAVDVVDLFDDVGAGPVDLLKLDCEGAEHAIVADPRFANLRPKLLVIECHDGASNASPTEAEKIARQLNAIGYETRRDGAMVWGRA